MRVGEAGWNGKGEVGELERCSKGEAREVEVDSFGGFGMVGLEVERKEEECLLLAPLEVPLAIDDIWSFLM